MTWFLVALPLAFGFLVSWCLTPLARRALVARGVMDEPAERSSHTLSTARGGGIACVLGTAAAMTTSAMLGVSISGTGVIAVVGIAIVGFLDDHRSLDPTPRLVAQGACGFFLGFAVAGLLAAVLGALIAVCVINAVNFMDGIDGITCLTMSVVGLGACLASAPPWGSATSGELVAVGAATAGVALGFLPWNFSTKSKIFLGDVGSYLFGGLCTLALCLSINDSSNVRPSVGAALLPYAADTAYTALRRLVRGDSLLKAHRDHIYQQLTVNRPHFPVAMSIAGLSLVLVFVWLAISPAPAVVMSIALLIIYLTSPRWMPSTDALTGVRARG